jgi:hypothetical protein
MAEVLRQTEEQGMLPPQAIVMQMVMGAWLSQTISAVTRLNIPDLLKAYGPQTASRLVQDHGVGAKPEFLERALRACASVGIFSEDAEGTFGPTALSEVLTSSSPVSIKKLTEIFGGTWWKVWAGLPDALRTGKPQAKAQLGMEYWDYCKATPKEMEDFGEAMKSNSHASIRGVLEHCDLSGVKKVVDVGGGFGHLAIALLRRYPDLRGIVLELPDLIPIARRHLGEEDPEVVSRIEFIGGDMFGEMPSADVYLMKHIIHDWNDAQCITLLGNCRASMDENGRVICVDAVLPPMGDTSGMPAKLLDIDMMVFIPGKERTRSQWEQLYGAAGLKITSITSLHDNFGTSIVEGRKI